MANNKLDWRGGIFALKSYKLSEVFFFSVQSSGCGKIFKLANALFAIAMCHTQPILTWKSTVQ